MEWRGGEGRGEKEREEEGRPRNVRLESNILTIRCTISLKQNGGMGRGDEERGGDGRAEERDFSCANTNTQTIVTY